MKNDWADEEGTLIETFLNGYCVGKLVHSCTASAVALYTNKCLNTGGGGRGGGAGGGGAGGGVRMK